MADPGPDQRRQAEAARRKRELQKRKRDRTKRREKALELAERRRAQVYRRGVARAFEEAGDSATPSAVVDLIDIAEAEATAAADPIIVRERLIDTIARRVPTKDAEKVYKTLWRQFLPYRDARGDAFAGGIDDAALSLAYDCNLAALLGISLGECSGLTLWPDMQNAILQGLAWALPQKKIFDEPPLNIYGLGRDGRRDIAPFLNLVRLWMTANSNFPTPLEFTKFLFPDAADAPPLLALLTRDQFDALLDEVGDRSFAVQTGPNQVQVLFRDPFGNVAQRDPLDMPLILVEFMEPAGLVALFAWNEDLRTYEEVTPSQPHAFRDEDDAIYLFVLSPGGGGNWVLFEGEVLNKVRTPIVFTIMKDLFNRERNSRDYTNVAHYLSVSENDFVGALRYVIDMQVDTGVFVDTILRKAARNRRFAEDPDYAFMNNLAAFVAMLYPIYYDDYGFKRAMANVWNWSQLAEWSQSTWKPRFEAEYERYLAPHDPLESLTAYQRLGLAQDIAEDMNRRVFEEEENEGDDSVDDSVDNSVDNSRDRDGSRKRTSSASGVSDRKRQKR